MATSIPQRKKILRLFREEKKSIQEIMEQLNLSYFKVYNVVKGRVKSTYRPRKDKGVSRKISEDERLAEQVNLEDFDDIDDFVAHQLVIVARSMNKQKLTASERLEIVKDISIQQKALQSRQLEKHLKNIDAILIARICRRFNSDLSDDDVIKIVLEEKEKLKAEAS